MVTVLSLTVMQEHMFLTEVKQTMLSCSVVYGGKMRLPNIAYFSIKTVKFKLIL